MKEFAVYTVMRLALFLASFAIVAGLWALATGGRVPAVPALVLALVLSGITSYFLLRRQRGAFAAKVEAKASRGVKKFEDRRSAEDAD